MSKNEKIKKLINFKYVKKGKDTLQKKAVKILIVFLILMIGCTILSRVADSMTIPRVKVDNIKSKKVIIKTIFVKQILFSFFILEKLFFTFLFING